MWQESDTDKLNIANKGRNPVFLFRLYLLRKMALRVSYLLSLTLCLWEKGGRPGGGRGQTKPG